MKQLFIVSIILIAGFTACKQQDKYHDSFFEDFNSSTPEYFQHHTGGNGADFTWSFGVDSPTEPETKILSFKIDPEDPAGAGRGPEIISCPTCGRCNINLFDIAEKIEKAVMYSTVPIKIAIMGCVVNGPGEAKEADIGIAGGDGIGILFKKGKVVKKFPQEKLVEILLHEFSEYEKDQKNHKS